MRTILDTNVFISGIFLLVLHHKSSKPGKIEAFDISERMIRTYVIAILEEAYNDYSNDS